MPMNRIIELQTKTTVNDLYGSEVETWTPLDKVWAEKLEVKPSERFIKTSARTVNTSQAKFRIRQRDDVDERMRVLADGILWDIIGIRKNDRRYLTLEVGHLA